MLVSILRGVHDARLATRYRKAIKMDGSSERMKMVAGRSVADSFFAAWSVWKRVRYREKSDRRVAKGAERR